MKPTVLERLAVWMKPLNLAKTVGSQVPVASAFVEMLNQVEGFELEQRVESIECEVKANKQLRELESQVEQTTAPLHDWSRPAAEYMFRTVDLAVAYDAGFHPGGKVGKELVLPIAHACLISPDAVVTCKEAREFVDELSLIRRGRVVAMVGMMQREVTLGAVDRASGLVVCDLGPADELKLKMLRSEFQKLGLDDSGIDRDLEPVRLNISPFIGQEIGIVHSGEADNVMRGLTSYTKRQFDTSTISHFRVPDEDGLKVGVTAVLPGRMRMAGAPAFDRAGRLVGVLSDTESYQSDAGRRAVLRTVLGHPYFMEQYRVAQGKGA